MKYSHNLLILSILIQCLMLGCNKPSSNRLRFTENSIKSETYQVYHKSKTYHIDLEEPVESVKKHEVTITNISDDIFEACFNCHVNYILNCACNSVEANGSFCITYKAQTLPEHHTLLTENIVVLNVKEPMLLINNFIKVSLTYEGCEKAMKLAKYYNNNEKLLMRKLRGSLSKFHRYDDVKFETPILAYFDKKVVNIDFENYRRVKDIDNMMTDGEYLKIWMATDTSNLIKLRALSTTNADYLSSNEVGQLFIKEKLQINQLDTCSLKHLEVLVDTTLNKLIRYKSHRKTIGKRISFLWWDEIVIK